VKAMTAVRVDAIDASNETDERADSDGASEEHAAAAVHPEWRACHPYPCD
jgi:hypothetical protein